MVSRRDATTLIGALGLGASAVPIWSQSASATVSVLPESPENQVKAKVRILGRTDDGESVWQSSSRLFALTEDGVVPLLQTRGAQRSWWRNEGEGVYRRFPSALNYFVDPVTGEFIDMFINPITGRATPLVSTMQRRQDGEVFTPMGSYFPISRQRFPEMYEEKPVSLDWRLDNETIRLFLTENFAPVAPKPIYEVHTYFAPAEEALSEAHKSARATSSGWYTGKFSRWLDMADVDGYLIWHFEGTKLNSIDDLDDAYIERARTLSDVFDVSPEFDQGPSYIDSVQKPVKTEN
ncbi:MAG: DUF1838 family protein [Rhodospirillaceae bacterium]